MTLWQSIVLGLVQGLTEFLPISSTAHLAIVPKMLGWENPSLAFKAVIQLGTLAAVLWYFRTDIVAITRATLCGESKLGWMIAAGTVPIVVLGLLFSRQIKLMNESLSVMAVALFALALLMALAEWVTRRRKTLRSMEQVGWFDSLIIGLAQSVALVPGSSRSGCTITGGLFLGLSRETAARFSFLLSLPAVFAAGIHELIGARHELLATQNDVHDLMVATLVSGIVGYASIAFLLGYLKKHTTYVFIVYRIALGAFLYTLLALGKL